MSKSNMEVVGNRCYSYGVCVAMNKLTEHGSYIVLDKKYYNYSVTTNKHITKFTGIDSKERKKLIAEGTITLENLN